MDSPRSDTMLDLSCSNMQTFATPVDEELKREAFITCMNKFAIYLYLALRKRGQFKGATESIEEMAKDFQVKMVAKNTPQRQQQRLVLRLLTVKKDPTVEEPLGDTMMKATRPPPVNEPVSENTNKNEQPEVDPFIQTEKEKENLIFIQAMTRLKTFVNNHYEVPSAKIHELLKPMLFTAYGNDSRTASGTASRTASGNYSRTDSRTDSRTASRTASGNDSGNDSGYGTSFDTQSSTCSGGGSVPANEIQKVMRAGRCNSILSRCVEAVIARLLAVISKNDVSVYENWVDSYLDLSVRTLNKLVYCLCLENKDNEVRRKCSSFIQQVIVDILSFEGMNNQLLYYKYYFVVNLIDSIYTCYDTIEFLFKKLSIFEAYAKDPQLNYKMPIHMIETSYYIYKILDASIYYYIHETKKNGAAVLDDKRGPGNYRKHKGKPYVDETEVKQNIDRWTKLLEQYNESLSGTFCLHSMYGSEILANVLRPEL